MYKKFFQKVCESLNRLVHYRVKQNIEKVGERMEHSFEDVYQQYRKKIDIASRKYSRMSGVPVPEFVSHLSESLWDSYLRYEQERGCSLDTWILKRLRQKAIDLMRWGEGNYYNRVFATLDGPPLSNSDSEDAPTSSVEMLVDEDYDVAYEVIKKKEADKRQLVDFLLESTTIHKDNHSTMTVIIEEYRKDDSRDKSDNAIAKSLGMHHETVKRKLESLAKRYDANRFGDVREYLAV